MVRVLLEIGVSCAVFDSSSVPLAAVLQQGHAHIQCHHQILTEAFLLAQVHLGKKLPNGEKRDYDISEEEFHELSFQFLGFSGAMLANIVNAAVILSGREGRTTILYSDLTRVSVRLVNKKLREWPTWLSQQYPGCCLGGDMRELLSKQGVSRHPHTMHCTISIDPSRAMQMYNGHLKVLADAAKRLNAISSSRIGISAGESALHLRAAVCPAISPCLVGACAPSANSLSPNILRCSP